MKSIIIVLLLAVASLASSKSIDLNGKHAEEFDWNVYFESGDGSTSTVMLQAQEAVRILRLRMDELCKQYRDLMTQRGEHEAVKLFDNMQENWMRYSEAEVAFVGTAWNGGSGQRAAIPRHRFIVHLRRVKELRGLKAQSLFLNE